MLKIELQPKTVTTDPANTLLPTSIQMPKNWSSPQALKGTHNKAYWYSRSGEMYFFVCNTSQKSAFV